MNNEWNWTLIPEFDELLERPLSTGQRTPEERYDDLLQAYAAGTLSDNEKAEFARLMNQLEDQQ
jgi:hypothetical protein